MSSEKVSSSSSSSSSTPRRTFDLFLGFRGEEILKNFADDLYTALKQKGINTFRDDERFERGKFISSEISNAIEESRIAITVISRNYSVSTWCLDELAKIVKCKKEMELTVFPIFYRVDPIDVRKQRGIFADHFAKHEERFKDNMEKVESWRAALKEVTNLSGWHLQDSNGVPIIRNIVGKILVTLNRSFPNLIVSMDFVGVDSRVKEIIDSCLGKRLVDVRFLGICGIGGIGKTTLARAIFGKIFNQFEASTFLANVREKVGKHDLVHLQKELLSDTLMESNINIQQDVSMGIYMIKSRLHNKKVLVILDDVDKSEQLKALAGGRGWFGEGSTIIITTRNKHLLIEHGLVEHEIYEAKELNNDEALQLFSWRAFEKDHPPKNYMEMSKKVLNYAKGRPLALEILGSFLSGRSEDEWRSALSRIKENFNREILDYLQLSLDGLGETEKNIFFDIACFFKGKDKDRVASILESCGYHPKIGIEVLLSKSLITISRNTLWMHDLLEELGREIVRRKYPNEPGKRSRLWDCDDAYRVLRENEGTEVVEGIFLNFRQNEEVYLNADAFSKMTRLRLLKICNVHLPQGLNHLSNELRVLEWHGYPSKSLPTNFKPDKLVELSVGSSRIEQIRDGILSSDKLKLIDFSDSQNLIKISDFTRVPNLERLILQGCTRLREVHPSIGVLKRLILLNLQDCNCLNSFPGKISLESLEVLILSGCSRLEKFPEIEGNMTHLSMLYLDRTTIKELPLSFKLLTGLTLLSLRDCKNLSTLPSVVCSLTSLKTLTLSGCSNLDKMPDNLKNMECLEELDASKTALRLIPPSILFLKNLKHVTFHGCKGLPPKSWHSLFACCFLLGETPEPVCLSLPNSFSGLSSLESLNLSDCNLLDGAIPNDLSGLSSLQSLDLSGNNFTSLPESFWQLSKLNELYLRNCSRLRSLPELPSSTLHVRTQGCTSLETYSDQINQPIDFRWHKTSYY